MAVDRRVGDILRPALQAMLADDDGPFLAGLDKLFNLLANWEMYLSPVALEVVPVSAGTFMRGRRSLDGARCARLEFSLMQL